MSAILPRFLKPRVAKELATVKVASEVIEAARIDAATVLEKLATTPKGLTSEQAQQRLEELGPNMVSREKRHTRLRLLGHAMVNPLVILLLILATLAWVGGDHSAAMVMTAMVVLGVVLRLVQESRADTAAAKLKAMIRVTATVVRDGAAIETPLAQLVRGDVIRLAAGDMIPADVRILSCKDLFITQASLTGESLPVEKADAPDARTDRSALELSNICFMGTSVESGSATAVVVVTGLKTYLGRMAGAMAAPAPVTSFDKGVNQFTWLMIRFMLVMTPLVFLINGLTKGNWHEAFFFAVAVAVGLTPEMLPMIVTVCLSKGAIAMSHKKVIVKRLNSIQNFGAMDVLCTDKTGTLTLDRIIIEKHCDVVRREDDDVLAMAYLNSHFQTGLKSALDRAVLEHREVHQEINVPQWEKVDEIPFDFSRRLMSVVVETPEDTHRIITKGAPEEVFKRCSRFELNNQLYTLEHIFIQDLKEEYESLSSDGFRVVALAYKDTPRKAVYSKDDETDMILRGYMAFLDPPKESAAPALVALQKHGVTAKVLTGDNDLVSRKICNEVGLSTEHMLLGSQVEAMSDAQLADEAEKTTLFARLSPAHKQRIIRALQSRGHAVGYLGDGINDALALRAADVGISVDSAVDIAKESADVILLEKSLLVLEEGVLEGRKVFANILKYVRMGASSNFGNMFSVLGASIFLPFLPMAPIQILTNNLLYDFAQVPIPTDEVDPEQIARPRPWSIKEITRFILFIGPCSSIFDYTTYFMMFWIITHWLGIQFNSPSAESLFQAGWFVESLLTQTLIIHVIRTNRIPFLQSRASWPMMAMTTVIMAIAMWLPFSPVAEALGFQALPGIYWPLLAGTLLAYLLLTQGVKTWLLKHAWISKESVR
ncbi:MAG: magnesium-translocating P-type ATPase [Planctomycetaceae bacterium]|nr:magnesium-translocating P-type ATPase [Planctomycetaceae bacterium]